jgi:two-component system OmpR family sensor kinase
VSIRRRLLLALVGTLLAIGLAASGITWFTVHEQANRLFDYQLEQMALSLRDQVPQSPGPFFPEAGPDFIVQLWDPSGVRLYLSNGEVALPEGPGGYQTLNLEGEDWRVFTLRKPDRTIQVAAPVSLRRDRATAMALRIFLPVLAAIPLYVILIWLIVGRGLRPLEDIARAIGRREPASLDPLPDQRLPVEVAPMVSELNALLERLKNALETQKRFTADAAHELRSPLTALQVQLGVVERAASRAEAREAIEALRAGIRRAARLVEQLLTMARVDPDAVAEPFSQIDIGELLASVAADAEPLAEAKRIEIRLADMQQAAVRGQPGALRALLRNLVDNAIRYTPQRGRVSLAVRKEGERTVVQVDDSGSGIPAAERARVFDRFYRLPGARGEGSGLGLAIVKQIAGAHHAEVSLHDSDLGGLRAEVKF